MELAIAAVGVSLEGSSARNRTRAAMSSATNVICHGALLSTILRVALESSRSHPQFLVNRPAPPATSLDHLKPFKLSTALMAVHKDYCAPIGLIQQGGPPGGETLLLAKSNLLVEPRRAAIRPDRRRRRAQHAADVDVDFARGVSYPPI